MRHPLIVVPCVLIAFLGASRAEAGPEVRAVQSPIRFNCAASGDPNCAGGQVLGDPAFAPVFSIVPGAAPGQRADASYSWVDPRIGTANGTSGHAIAEFGLLHATASASVSSSPVLGSSSPNLMRLGTFSFASFTDTLTIMAPNPALNGAPGSFTASVLVHGSLDPSEVNGNGSAAAMSSADWRMEIHAGSAVFGNTNSLVPGFSGYEVVDAAGNATFGNLGPNGLVTFTAPFVFGAPFDLTTSFQAAASAVIDSAVVRPLTQGLQLAAADSLYFSTAAWNGIQTVRSGGLLVSDYTVVSASGTPYALAVAAVPEPESITLLAAGLAVLAVIRRRRAGRR